MANIAFKRLGTAKLALAIWGKLRAQRYACPYTGDRLIPGVNASLDHIKPVSLYPELARSIDNVEWVTLDVNLAKRTLDSEQFIALCRRVTIHRSN